MSVYDVYVHEATEYPEEPHTTYKRQAHVRAMVAQGSNPWASVRDAVLSTPDPYDGFIDADAEEV